MSALDDLKQRMADVVTLESTHAVLEWDQQAYMPPAGVTRRSTQLALIDKLKHDMVVSADTERLLAQAEKDATGLDPDSDEAAYLRMARRDFDRAAKLPTALIEEIAQTAAMAHEQWAAARSARDYGRFAPWLQKTLDLQRRVADLIGYKAERYDALLDQYEPDMTASDVRVLFNRLKPPIVALVKAIAQRGPDAVDSKLLSGQFEEASQRAFAERVIKQFGFDFGRGRQDLAAHPFCTSFSRDDVRITTRFDRNFLPAALFATFHETGHALYELNVADRYDGNVLAGGVSMGVHESQSRLWENLVGRSRNFWEFYYQALRQEFPTLADVDLEKFYRAINRVEPSLIRVEADEVTYNLHIILRFEMEVDLLEERITVAEAPELWNVRCQDYLGLTPPDDARGILQDVHWSFGGFGYFPTYTLGNVLSVQLMDAADNALAGRIPELIGRGEFAPLREWLAENIHQWGRKYTPAELIHRATGRPMDPEPYIRYLQTKFGDIYDI